MPKGNSSEFFCNRECKYFPCHNGIDKDEFNCLFCFCPLNSLINCGGNYTVTKDGKKDCSKCTYPHRAENYQKVVDKVRKMLDQRKFPEDGERI